MEVDNSGHQPIAYTAMDGKISVLKYPESFHNSTSDNWLNLSQKKLCIFPGRLCICMVPGDPKLAIQTSHLYPQKTELIPLCIPIDNKVCGSTLSMNYSE